MSKSFRVLCTLVAGVLLSVCLPVIACVSLQVANLGNTYGWAGESQKDGKLVHVMLYHNSARNLFERKHSWDANITEPMGNAMILPIPAVPGSMSSKNMLDGSKYIPIGRMLYDASPGWAEKALKALLESYESMAAMSMAGSKGAAGKYEIFQRGSYTVVLADNVSMIPEALEKVPLKVRPRLNKAIFDAYEKWYPGWTFALCCFEYEAGGEPIVWWYEPKDPSQLFFPALDEHSGKPPALDKEVDVDHHLTVSSNNMITLLEDTSFSAVRKVLAALPTDPEFVPKHVMGRAFSGRLPQGDFVFSTTDLKMGIFRPMRKLPPGAPQDPLVLIANYLFDPSLTLKVTIAIALGSIVCLFQLRLLRFLFLSGCAASLGFLVLFIALEYVRNHYVANAFWQASIAIAALLLPIVIFAPKGNRLPYIAATIVLIATMFMLPGYSSAWAPFIWALILAKANSEIGQQAPTAAAVTASETKQDEQS